MQGRQLGIPDSVPFVMRTLTIADVHAAGEAAEGAITFVGWASTADTPGNHAFVQNHSAKYGGGAETTTQPGRMPLSIFWLKQLPMPNPPIQSQFETHWQISQISTPFLENSLLTRSGMPFTTRRY